ncbi:Protein Z-dependent protease inhibitor [Thelohanellus kitauei]|uniref:Protein Z-dependent protease inhibitor n=1 Tax=Thelohanellus kitauei TaxID=669202 RepID=A0A0C2J377_THEKT|nr:Protein Z-dependent protease inhibitor [Thelohanellus kitauei]
MDDSLINHFGFRVMNDLFEAQHHTGNLAFSGVTLYILMAILSVGLRNQTLNQLTDFLGQDFQELLDPDNWPNSLTTAQLTELRRRTQSISIWTSIMFHSGDIEKTFKNISELILDMDFNKIDFSVPPEANRRMNEVVERRTGWMMKNVFDQPINMDVSSVLINTLYFFGEWADKFSSDYTELSPFNIDEEEIMVSMMYKEGEYNYFHDKTYQIEYLYIPFKRQNLYAVIILPEHGLPLKEILSKPVLSDLRTPLLSSIPTKVRLELPKFNVLTRLDLAQTLIDHNVSNLFTSGLADMSGISAQLKAVDKLIQVVNILVNERGSNPGSGGVTRLGPAFMGSDIVNFCINRPFLYQIYSSDIDITLISTIITNPEMT